MPYNTVFDVTHVGFQWWIPALIGMFAGLFVLIGWGIKSSGDSKSRLKGWVFLSLGLVGLMGGVTFFLSMYSEYQAAKQALTHHDYSVAEGVVTQFIPMPTGGHSIESFVVDGVRFEYGSGWGSATFNSEWNKAFIHDGVRARITYVGKDILKVEVK